MAGDAKLNELRRATNPLFNDRKLKLGTFCTNLSGGCAITTMPGTLDITWPNTVRLAQLADEMEFEAIVPVGRWKGFGEATNFNGAGFECFSWAAGIGAVTKYPAVFATSHVPMYHPALAAKQVVIDHISNGRHAINIVGGWLAIRADLTVGCDGRHSTLRDKAGLTAIEHGVPGIEAECETRASSICSAPTCKITSAAMPWRPSGSKS
jgi:hypothetical protein